ncbi:S1 family peptidase [Mycobacterium sp. E740]|uniref:S1 family peptidase n=1 Tax=Mycobacterium sp. E740 TaxID=1834149 RepID=UPI0009EF089B|nr:S1 family peptidase [Mycobacterium sp. E740]
MSRLAATIAVAAALISTPAVAAAQERVSLGGGSGLVVNGETLCTLTTIGNDNRGKLIGFTSAHCGGPGAQVAAEGAEAAGVLGTMVAGNDALDYAVIEFDPQKVRPVNNVNGFQIDGLGPDPVVGDIACKLGRTTGYSCGVTWGRGEQPGTIVNQVCGQPGDSGAPVTVNNRLVGMIHGAFSQALPTCVIKYIPLHTPAVTMSFNTQLADITAKNRPGTGFTPVGG